MRQLAVCSLVFCFGLNLPVWLGCRRSPEGSHASQGESGTARADAPQDSAQTGKPPGFRTGTAAPVSPGVPQVAGPPPGKLWEAFSGQKALEAVAAQVRLGARPSGSANLEKCRMQIQTSLGDNGWEVEQQVFTEETPRGPVRFVNLVGRFRQGKTARKDTQRALVCSHYDTKRFSTIEFLGACDGASSSGALVELSRVLALRPGLAEKVELVFFDGEEAFVQFSETDGLYGSRFYARSLREAGRSKQFRFGILWDMIGDRDLTLTLPPDSPQPLTRNLLESAEALRFHSHFSYFDRPILDDHVPLNMAGIPTVDLIDFDYLSWHTADDTLDKLSAKSLEQVGALTVHYLERALPAGE
jgi:glutaminyl-peptide cyclotransferase